MTHESRKISQSKWRDKNREHIKKRNAEHFARKSKDPTWTESRRQTAIKSRDKCRLAVMMAYGGPICSCDHNGKPCGPHPIEFLAIDHINGDNKEVGKRCGAVFYRRLKKLGYPPGFRVLCHNCNHSLGVRGYCPLSKTEKQEQKHKKRESGQLLDIHS
jgi:hypothetical protein